MQKNKNACLYLNELLANRVTSKLMCMAAASANMSETEELIDVVLFGPLFRALASDDELEEAEEPSEDGE